MKPKSYKVQNSCTNCKHVFEFMEYDQGSTLYCHQDKSKRPLCGSVLLNESHTLIAKGSTCRFRPEGEYDRLEKKWKNWAKRHIVDGSGTCDSWKNLTKKERIKRLNDKGFSEIEIEDE